uniref:Uncharacterized protein n=1 Tax=Lates calcarifer TaxID=8187 RepID=A0A4W6C100_LATCA
MLSQLSHATVMSILPGVIHLPSHCFFALIFWSLFLPFILSCPLVLLLLAFLSHLHLLLLVLRVTFSLSLCSHFTFLSNFIHVSSLLSILTCPVQPHSPSAPQTNLLHSYDQLPRSVSSMSLMRSTPSPLPPPMSASTSPIPPQMVSSTSPLPPQVNSSSPFPEPKHGRHFSSESTHSHSSAEDQRGDGMGMGTGTGSTSTHSSGCRSSHRERRSWQDLIETPLTSAGLHFLQTAPGESDYGGLMGSMAGDMGLYGGLGRHGMSPERRRQATLPVRRHHAAERDRERDGPFPLERGPHTHSHTHRRSHKQRSQSLPRNRDPMPGKLIHTSAHMEERSEDEEAEGQAGDMLEGEEGKKITHSLDYTVHGRGAVVDTERIDYYVRNE